MRKSITPSKKHISSCVQWLTLKRHHESQSLIEKWLRSVSMNSHTLVIGVSCQTLSIFSTQDKYQYLPRSHMQQDKFYVYSKDGCGFCDRLTQFMESKGVHFEKFNLGADYSSEDFVNQFGYNSSFPQVVYHSQKIGGMKDTVRYLLENKIV